MSGDPFEVIASLRPIIAAGFRRIDHARRAAGVKPGEPLLNLSTPTPEEPS